MAVYNAEKTVAKSIRSILSQTYDNFEYIIVDDGSDDKTPDLARQVGIKDPRVHFFRTENQGLTHALNFGCSQARGEYIARMDGDDIAFASRLERQLNFMESDRNIVCCGTSAVEIDDAGRPFRYWRPPTSHAEIDSMHLKGFGGGVIHPTSMFRRDVFESLGGYDTRWKLAQDFDLWFRMAEVGQLANLSDCLLYYRRGSFAISQKRRTEQWEFCSKIIQEARLRRGLGISHDFPKAPPQHDTETVFLQLAMRDHFYKTAMIYALRNWTGSPMSKQNFFQVLRVAKYWVSNLSWLRAA
jgi:glycosyltransferase involved in cell wall biosynthesis